MTMPRNRVYCWIFCCVGLIGVDCRPQVQTLPATTQEEDAGVEGESAQGSSEVDAIGEGRAAEVGEHLVGSMAPAVALQGLDGVSVSLTKWLGRKPIYLKFWATWCKPCREQMAHFESVHQMYGDQLAVIGINAGLNDSLAQIAEFQQTHAMTMPVMIDVDGSVARAFHLRVTPQHVLIDRHGQIVHVGHLAQSSLDAKIAKLVRSASDSGGQRAAASAPSPVTPFQLQPLALLGGAHFDLASEQKQPVLLSFFATWCDWYMVDLLPEVARACEAQQTRMNALYQKYKDRAQWIGVAQSLWTDEGQVEAYQERRSVQFPLGLDTGGSWFAKFGVRQLPMTVLLDAQGTEIARMKGDPSRLEALLQGLKGDE